MGSAGNVRFRPQTPRLLTFVFVLQQRQSIEDEDFKEDLNRALNESALNASLQVRRRLPISYAQTNDSSTWFQSKLLRVYFDIINEKRSVFLISLN